MKFVLHRKSVKMGLKLVKLELESVKCRKPRTWIVNWIKDKWKNRIHSKVVKSNKEQRREMKIWHWIESWNLNTRKEFNHYGMASKLAHIVV